MDIAQDRDAVLDRGPWRRNLIVCVFGSFTTIVAMTLLLPFLPLYVEQLGVTDHAAIVQWSGVAYGATFFSAALTAPLWGRLADLYGRKLMLIRASLGMAVAMSLLGMAHTTQALAVMQMRQARRSVWRSQPRGDVSAGRKVESCSMAMPVTAATNAASQARTSIMGNLRCGCRARRAVPPPSPGAAGPQRR